MSPERLLAVEESFKRLSVLDKSLNLIADKSRSPSAIKNIYSWLHQKLNAYLMNSTHVSERLDPNLVTEYLTYRKTLMSSKRSAYRGDDVPGFQLIVDLAANSIQQNENGEYTSEEFIAFQQLILEMIKCNNLAPYNYFLKFGRSPIDLNVIKTNSRKFSPIYQFGEICQKWFSLPDLASGILKMVEIDSADFSAEYIEDTLRLLAMESTALKNKEQLIEVMTKKIEDAKYWSSILIANSLSGIANLFDVRFGKVDFINFEASIKDKAYEEFGFK